jgi:hypothetical protein
MPAELWRPIKKELQKRAKPKSPAEEGAFGVYDEGNRISYSITKPAAIVTGIAAVGGLPFAGPLFVGSAFLAGTDKGQLEISKWVRRRTRGNMRRGEAVTFPKAA